MLTLFPPSTGEKNHGSPSETLNGEEKWRFRMYDPSKQSPKPSNHAGTCRFIDCNNLPSLRASKPRKPKTVVKHPKSIRGLGASNSKVKGHARDTVDDSSSPSTSQQGADDHDQANVKPQDAAGPSSAGPTTVMPNENMAPNVQQSAYGEQPDVANSIAPTSLDTHGWSADTKSPHGTGHDAASTMPVTPDQGDVLPDPATDVNWSIFDTLGFTAPYTTGTYDPALNPEMLPFTGDFAKLFLPGYESWDEAQWDCQWEQFHANTA